MSRAAPVIPSFLILIIVFVMVLLAIYPAFPKVTVTIRVQASNPRFQLIDAKLERLTFVQAVSITRGTVFVYPIETQPQSKFTLSIVISYGSQILATNVLTDLSLGLYSLSVVLDPHPEQANVLYHLNMIATFPDGISVQIEGNVPPS